MLRKMYAEIINEEKHSRFSSIGNSTKNPRDIASRNLDLAFYINAIDRNRWAISAFAAAMTLAAIIYSIKVVPTYASTATLLLEPQKTNVISIEELISPEQSSSDYYGTQYAVLRSRALSEQVLQYLIQSGQVTGKFVEAMFLEDNSKQSGIFVSDTAASKKASDDADIPTASYQPSNNWGEHLGYEKYNSLIEAFRKSIKVSPISKTKLVKITYESKNAEFSTVVANAIATQYIERSVQQGRIRKAEASAWMDSRIQELQFKLTQSENALLTYMKSNGLVDLAGGVERLDSQRLIFTSGELAKAKVELANARDMYAKTQRYLKASPERLETLFYIKNDQTFRTIDSQLIQAQRDLNELKNRYGNKHPKILDSLASIETLRSTQRDNINRLVAIFENDYQLLQQRVSYLESSIATGKNDIQSMGQQKFELETLQKEVDANREQYNKLFERMTELRTTDGLSDVNAVISEAAWVPTKPVKPNKVLLVAIVFLASLLIAASVACIREFFNDTVKKTSDIHNRLNSRLLGVIPQVQVDNTKISSEIPVSPSDISVDSEMFSEAVKTTRTALTINSDSKCQVILVTSSVPNEGKSTVAMNLAHSFGQMGRTLLLDCDLRRPSIAAALGIDNDESGLTNLLLEKSIKKGTIKCGVFGSFDCLTSGPVPTNPLELIASEKFASGLEALKSRYDRIIIDSAPVHVVSDALVLSQMADQVLFVVKPHETPIKLVHESLSRLHEAQATVAGICISQLDVSKAKTYGDMEFHGFGMNYQGYGKYYTQRTGDDRVHSLKLAS